MKYFTPDLYLRYNSADDKIADQADEAWEQALERYQRYLKEHRAKLPPSVRALAQKNCFHDAVLLGWQTHETSESRKNASPLVFTLGLQQANETVVLYYFLSDLPNESKRPRNWPFSPEHKHWLYDEIAVAEDATFVHRILWSDGAELGLAFTDVLIDRFPAFSPVAAI